MGLLEQLRSGAKLSRKLTPFTMPVVGSGSVELGNASAFLSIQSSEPIRLRFYDNQASRDEVGEISRVFGDYDIGQPIRLVADISMSAAGTYTLDPVVFSVSDDGLVYYRTDQVGNTPNIAINTFLMEDVNITVSPESRRTLPTFTASLAAGAVSSGSVEGADIPKTFILVSASLDAGVIGRIRLYSYSGSIDNATEKTRPFETEPSASIGLIVDAVITGSEGLLYFAPKIVGANLDNMQSDLPSTTNVAGENRIHYILQNANTAGGTVPISASLSIFSLEN